MTTKTRISDSLGAATLANTASYRLTSAYVNQTFAIDVAPPPFGYDPDKPLPVLYVLDGDMTFGAASVIARSLQMGPGAVPPVLVVGVGYAPGGHSSAALRVRDLTPSIDHGYVQVARSLPGAMALPPELNPGGADDFLDFLEDELMPFIAARYAVLPGDQAVVGMSLGGLLVLHCLFARPEVFGRYGAISPSIWWDGRMVLDEEAGLARRTKDLAARVFLAVGELEEAQDATAKMVSNLYELDATLRRRSYPSLELKACVFPGEGHMSVFPGAFSRAVRELYA